MRATFLSRKVSADDAANDTTDKASDEAESVDDIKPSYQEPEIDNRVFDDYKNQTKVFSIDQPSGAKEKDYGSYFDDYEDVKPSAKSVAIQDFDPFAAVTENDNYKDEKKSRKGLIIAIIVGICIILALLAALGLIACNNGFFGSNPRRSDNRSLNYKILVLFI